MFCLIFISAQNSRVAEFDSIEKQDALGVGENERVEGQDLEHLESGHQSAATLLDYMTN